MKYIIYACFILFSTVSLVGDEVKNTKVDYKSSKVQYQVSYNATVNKIKGQYRVILKDVIDADMILEGDYTYDINNKTKPKLKLNGTHSKSSSGVTASVFFAEDDNNFCIVFVYGKSLNSALILNEFMTKYSMQCTLSSINDRFSKLDDFEILILK